ncbi:MAG: aspartate carbamoyltransferase regulatory subunit [Candidatus Nanohaloarchaea archaeon]|nr:aspartate carbamoyltransferase regulatory subunit [Candidatus Nanohaloarchaea archaeon]
MPSLRVSKIESGTVLDHIPAGNGRTLLQVLDIDWDADSIISLIMNVDSHRIGMKDILKIEGKELDPGEVTAAALFAPSATLNIIQDYDVVEKRDVTVPDRVEEVLDCPNPDCVTNAAEPVVTRFTVVEQNPVVLHCTYCESRFEHDDLDLPRF